MKNILMMLVLLLGVAGCQTDSTSTSSSSSIAPPTMSDGEVVSYRFNYSDNSSPTSVHKIIKVSDGKESGEITYSIDNENNTTMQLDELDNVKLTDEQSFILGGSPLPPTGGEIINNIVISEEQTSVTVEAGTYPVYKNTYNSGDANITDYNHMDSIKPLKGLVKYIWSERNSSITVELIEWNNI